MLFATSASKLVCFGRSIASATRRASGPLALAAAAVTCLAGCPNVQGELEDFEKREVETRPPPVPVECGTAATTVEGRFLFALSTELSPKNPVLFDTEITTDAGGLNFAVTALNEADRKTPVGDTIDVGPYPIDTATGTFVAALPKLTVDGTANPITTGSQIVATVTLAGAVCEEALCGDITGVVEEPIDYTLTKSTFYMQKLAEGEATPAQPFIDCDKNLADPL
ncbi:MAG: hypothetical protein WKG00_08845 [Polyangiaceae bacterium]